MLFSLSGKPYIITSTLFYSFSKYFVKHASMIVNANLALDDVNGSFVNPESNEDDS